MQEFANIFAMVYIHENWSLYDLKVLEKLKLKLKFWTSFNEKNIYYYERSKQFWTLKPWIREKKSFAQNVKVLFS